MNTVIRTIFIILLLSAATAEIRAQEGLHSASIFQKYGKQKGVTLVELSKDMLVILPLWGSSRQPKPPGWSSFLFPMY